MSGDPNLPDDSATDRDVTRRWREQATEQPLPATDARIRAAAREALRASAVASPDATRHGRRWSRYVPLAAAASVALLAVGLVRLIPRDEYQAIPVKPEAAMRRDAASEAELRRDAAPEAAAPSAPAPAAELAPVEADTGVDAQRTAPTDATVSVESRGGELRALRKPVAPAGDEGQALEERPRQSSREAPTAAQGVPRQAVAPPTAAPSPPSSAITTTSASRGAAADADAAALLPVELARRVRDDAARRAAVDPAAIRIVAVDPVMWFDTSLGCEAGAMAAPEMRVPGYVVTVDADGTEFRYHTDDRERIRICGDD
jgi:hypothetical protein